MNRNTYLYRMNATCTCMLVIEMTIIYCVFRTLEETRENVLCHNMVSVALWNDVRIKCTNHCIKYKHTCETTSASFFFSSSSLIARKVFEHLRCTRLIASRSVF